MPNELTQEYQLNKDLTIRQLKSFMDNYGTSDLADIGGNGMQERLAVFGWYPDVYDKGLDGFDICQTPLPRQYDTIICLNTYEHIIDPVRASENIVKSLKADGYCFISTVWIYPKHDYGNVIDTYRYTDMALKVLFADLEMIKCWYEDEVYPPSSVRVSFIGHQKKVCDDKA